GCNLKVISELVSLSKIIRKRCYASARQGQTLTEPFSNVKPVQAAPFSPQDVQVSKLPNGLVIASVENYSPLSSVGVFIRAGSRHENSENLGVSHVLRLAANLLGGSRRKPEVNIVSLHAVSFLIKTKRDNLTQLCSHLFTPSVTGSRENMIYSADCLRDDLYRFVAGPSGQRDYSSGVSAVGGGRATSRVKIDRALAQQCPQISVIEKLHEAAYKNALSNSLYCPDFMVGRISSEQLHSFVKDNFTTGRMALVGVGVNHSVLKQVGEGLLSTRSGAGAPVDKAAYRGGELRVQNGDDLVHALVVSEGGVTGTAEANAFSVLQRILGASPHVKRGSSITSKLSQGVAKATAQPFDATAFNASYSDSGLFGVYTIAQANSAREVIRAAVAQVRGVAEGNVTEADIIRAKDQAKAEYLMSIESSEGLLEEIGAQALNTAAYQAPESVLHAIDAITKADVVKVARKFADGKKTMAASGH
ncbi:hypothetical protein CCH79_00014650, partial [Gambusia affinis]